MIRRPPPAVTAFAAAVAAAVLCAGGSLWRQATLMARVDGTSAWSELRTQRSVLFQTWRDSLSPHDWLLFAGAGLLAAALVTRRGIAATARRLTMRFAGPGRGTE